MNRYAMLAAASGLSLGLMCTTVDADGPYCLKLTPFVDVIELDVQWFFTLDAVLVGQMPGEPVAYRLEGGGPASYNHSEQVWPLDITLRNDNAPMYFGNHSICRLVAVLENNLTGAWAADCIGNGFGAFYGWGTTMPVTCGVAPLSVSEHMQAYGVAPKLAGVK
jgi:hypothetical protein